MKDHHRLQKLEALFLAKNIWIAAFALSLFGFSVFSHALWADTGAPSPVQMRDHALAEAASHSIVGNEDDAMDSEGDFGLNDKEGYPSRFGQPPPKREMYQGPHRPDPYAKLSSQTKSRGRQIASSSAGSGVAALRTAAPLVQEMGLVAGDLGYFPQTLIVSAGIPVRLFVTSASKKPLCLMQDDYQVRRQVQLRKIEEITFTPETPGRYRFYCPVNGIEGTLVVKEPSIGIQ